MARIQAKTFHSFASAKTSIALANRGYSIKQDSVVENGNYVFRCTNCDYQITIRKNPKTGEFRIVSQTIHTCQFSEPIPYNILKDEILKHPIPKVIDKEYRTTISGNVGSATPIPYQRIRRVINSIQGLSVRDRLKT